MRSHELARQLLDGPDLEVVMSSDPEGNSFDTLEDVEQGMWWAEEKQTYPTPEEVEERDDMTEDDLAPEDAERVIVLWP